MNWTKELKTRYGHEIKSTIKNVYIYVLILIHLCIHLKKLIVYTFI